MRIATTAAFVLSTERALSHQLVMLTVRSRRGRLPAMEEGGLGPESGNYFGASGAMWSDDMASDFIMCFFMACFFIAGFFIVPI